MRNFINYADICDATWLQKPGQTTFHAYRHLGVGAEAICRCLGASIDSPTLAGYDIPGDRTPVCIDCFSALYPGINAQS